MHSYATDNARRRVAINETSLFRLGDHTVHFCMEIRFFVGEGLSEAAVCLLTAPREFSCPTARVICTHI